MKEIFNLAIIGYGGMASFHVSDLIPKHKEIKIIGGFDIDESRQQALKNDGFVAYISLEELLNDSNIDVVLIATPNDSHKEIAIKSLKAKKNVICEKPAMMSSADLVEVLEVARKNDVYFTAHQNRRWDKDFLTISNIYKNRSIGDVFQIESRVHGANGIPGDWRKEFKSGGGMLLDWGVHLLDQLLYLVDSEIATIYSTMSYILGNDVDDGFCTIITFKNGVRALVEVDTTNYIRLPRWYIKGNKGTAINDWDNNGKMVIRNEDVTIIPPKPIKAGEGFTKTMAPPSENATATEVLPEAFKMQDDFYSNFMKTINGTSEQIVQNDQALRVLRLIEAIFESVEKNIVINNFE